MNGAEMKTSLKWNSHLLPAPGCGEDELFVSELDESDGSIAFFEPHFAVMNDVSLDHEFWTSCALSFAISLQRRRRWC